MDDPRAEVEIKSQLKTRGSVAKEEDPKPSHQLYKLQIKPIPGPPSGSIGSSQLLGRKQDLEQDSPDEVSLRNPGRVSLLDDFQALLTH